MRKKVLYIGGFNLPDKNAAAHRVIGTAKIIREAGFDVEFFCITNEPDQVGVEKEVDGFKYVARPYPKSMTEWLKYITNFIQSDYIKHTQCNYVLMYNFPAIAGKRVAQYCHKSGIKVYAELTEWYVAEGYSPRSYMKRFDTFLRMSVFSPKLDGVIATSKHLMDYYGDKINNLMYLPFAVDLREKKWRRDREIMANTPVKLVYAGSPGGKQKDRVDELVNSALDFPYIMVDILGITAEQYLKDYNVGISISPNITFHGRVPHAVALKMVQDADFEVIIRDDNRVTRAGFPTKFVEAFSCGTSVIATPSSNICDYLKDGENGFVIDSHQSLKACLGRIMRMNEKEIKEIKSSAKEVTAFDYRNYVEAMKVFLK